MTTMNTNSINPMNSGDNSNDICTDEFRLKSAANFLMTNEKQKLLYDKNLKLIINFIHRKLEELLTIDCYSML